MVRYGRVDLLLLDELGYVRLYPRRAERLFQVITGCDEKASIGLAWPPVKRVGIGFP